VGYWISSDANSSGVEVDLGVLVFPATTGVSSGLTVSPAQLAAGIPGSDVSRQQMVNVRTKTKDPVAMTSARPQKTILRIGKRWKLILGILVVFRKSGKSAYHSSGLMYTIVDSGCRSLFTQDFDPIIGHNGQDQIFVPAD
jgi:hypothetical protein